ncbi:alpha/beta fold hydrolase [Alienimonas californiensis]|uniref:Non-heme chloroperoxidase n=1 Tax=Alienimonas californiensis TaxID=2527989 RepID=A0A517P7A0_9PLAN|nr:alpha/beta hydrolase [Alienimonas californiensis]QDT15242.1 Non-heme chloroperoxidase [Alienimonas californiensis]
MSYVTARDGARLYYKAWGEGRPVILIHGWPLSADSWDAIALPLAEAGYRTIAYDRRGFGRSEQTWTGYNYDALSDDLADVMKEIGARQDVALVGFSMGGGEVARYMSRHDGAGVTRAALISSIVPYMLKTDDNPEGVDQSVFDGIAAGLKKDRPGFYGGFFKDFYGVGVLSQPVSDEYLEWTRTVAMQGSLKATLDCANAFATTDFRGELSRFTVPTLVVHGTSDATVPIDASGRPAAAGIPNAVLKEYDGAPHGLFQTHRDRLRDDLLAFLAQ